MEDTYFVGEISGLPAQDSFGHGHQMPANLAVCSVFDGHGGASVSEYCSKHFQGRATGCIGQLLGGSAVDFHEAVLTGLRRAFLALDQELGKEAQLCGTTATACILSEDQIYIASCGDSRAIIARDGSALQLIQDHSLDRQDEKDRVIKAGGRVLWNNGYRVMGALSMSRALGDKVLQSYGVSPEPEVARIPRSSKDDFLLVATDGLWNAMTNQECVDICQQALRSGRASRQKIIAAIPNLLANIAIKRGSSDNITIICLDLQPTKPVAPLAPSRSLPEPLPMADILIVTPPGDGDGVTSDTGDSPVPVAGGKGVLHANSAPAAAADGTAAAAGAGAAVPLRQRSASFEAGCKPIISSSSSKSSGWDLSPPVQRAVSSPLPLGVPRSGSPTLGSSSRTVTTATAPPCATTAAAAAATVAVPRALNVNFGLMSRLPVASTLVCPYAVSSGTCTAPGAMTHGLTRGRMNTGVLDGKPIHEQQQQLAAEAVALGFKDYYMHQPQQQQGELSLITTSSAAASVGGGVSTAAYRASGGGTYGCPEGFSSKKGPYAYLQQQQQQGGNPWSISSGFNSAAFSSGRWVGGCAGPGAFGRPSGNYNVPAVIERVHSGPSACAAASLLRSSSSSGLPCATLSEGLRVRVVPGVQAGGGEV